MKKLSNDLIPLYKVKHIKKINSMRDAQTQPEIHLVPVLTKGQVLFVTAASRHNEPNSCYNCWKYNEETKTCAILPQEICIKKFVAGERFKSIEYWPVCGMHEYGEPNKGKAVVHEAEDPDYVGLSWINAPEVGQPCGGTNCGGKNGGDDCDHWQVEPGVEDKRDVRVAFCRVLQSPTAAGDCCAAWDDDDIMDWQTAQGIIKNEK